MVKTFSRRLSNFLQTHIFWKFDHFPRICNQISHRNIWFPKVTIILIKMVQVLFLDHFSEKTRTLMPLSSWVVKVKQEQRFMQRHIMKITFQIWKFYQASAMPWSLSRIIIHSLYIHTASLAFMLQTILHHQNCMVCYHLLFFFVDLVIICESFRLRLGVLPGVPLKFADTFLKVGPRFLWFQNFRY